MLDVLGDTICYIVLADGNVLRISSVGCGAIRALREIRCAALCLVHLRVVSINPSCYSARKRGRFISALSVKPGRPYLLTILPCRKIMSISLDRLKIEAVFFYTKIERGEKMKPCYGCASRAIGCHGTCERYAEAKRIRDEEMKARRNDPVRGYAIAKAAKRDPALYERAHYY